MPIFEVEAPDGSTLEVEAPEGVTQEQVLRFAKTSFKPQEKEESGFTQSMQARGRQLANIVDRAEPTKLGGQGIAETAFQIAGTELGAIGDVIGQGLLLAAKSAPEPVKEAVTQKVSEALDTDVGKKAVKAMQQGSNAWQEFAKENPRAAANIGSAFNVATFSTPVKGVSGLRATTTGVKKLGKSAVTAKEAIKEIKLPVPTSDDLAQLAGKSYKQAEQLGGVLKPEITNRFVNTIEKLGTQTEIGKLVAGDDAVSGVIQRISSIKNKPMTLEAAQEVDELLGRMVGSAPFSDAGQITKQGKKVLQIQEALRDTIEKANIDEIMGGKEGFESLKQARKLWSASRKLSDIESILARAEFSNNAATTIKTGFRTILTNPKRLKGYTKREIQLMRKAAKTGIIPDLLRTTVGSRLIPIINISTGGGFGAGAATTGASIAARGAAEQIGVSQAQRVAREIAKQAGGQ